MDVVYTFLLITKGKFRIDMLLTVGKYRAFELAVLYGDLTILEKLLELTPDLNEREEMIHKMNERAFIMAAGNQNIFTLEVLLSLCNEEKQKSLLEKDLSERRMVNPSPEKILKELNSDLDFIAKLRKLREQHSDSIYIKINDAIEFNKNINNLSQADKNKFSRLLSSNKPVLEKLLSHLDTKNSSLTDLERIAIFSIKLESNKNCVEENISKDMLSIIFGKIKNYLVKEDFKIENERKKKTFVDKFLNAKELQFCTNTR